MIRSMRGPRLVFLCASIVGLGAALAAPAAGLALVPAAQPTAPAPLTAAPAAPSPEQHRTFAEPLLPVGEPDAADTRELALAIDAYRAAVDVEAVQPLLHFLDQHPASAWRPSLLANLAVLYRHTGYLDRSPPPARRGA
jgi:hypothetical protein